MYSTNQVGYLTEIKRSPNPQPVYGSIDLSGKANPFSYSNSTYSGSIDMRFSNTTASGIELKLEEPRKREIKMPKVDLLLLQYNIPQAKYGVLEQK